MDTVLQLLNSKGHEVWTIHPDETYASCLCIT
jgi:hypothetical protein